MTTALRVTQALCLTTERQIGRSERVPRGPCAPGQRRTIVRRRVGKSSIVVVLLSAPACTSRESASPTASTPARILATTTHELSPTTTSPQAHAQFCELAARAAEGNIDLTDPALRATLAEFPGLTDGQRSRLVVALEDATIEVSSGSGWSNHLLVAIVNEVCGLSLTPVTMTP